MTAQSIDPADRLVRDRLRAVRSWRLWSVPPRALVLIVGVELLTAVAVAASLAASYSECLTGTATARLLLVLVLAVAYGEITARMQRMRRFLGGAVMIGLHSVWAFAGVLILPIGYSATLVCALFLVAALRRRQQKAVAYRLTYTGATVVLATLAAKVVATGIQPHIVELPSDALTAAAIVLAALVFFVVNIPLVAMAIYLASGVSSVAELVPARQELGLEAATLVLGVMTADISLRLVLADPDGADPAGAAAAQLAGLPAGARGRHRRQDRPAQRRGLAGAGPARTGAGPARRLAVRGPAARPRPLQTGQRHPRAPGRRLRRCARSATR